jgi:hypothetical protein
LTSNKLVRVIGGVAAVRMKKMQAGSLWSYALRSDWLKLVLIIGLGVFLVSTPRFSYPLPLHADEWAHLAYARDISQTGQVLVDHPFSGDVTSAVNYEAGFQVFLSTFQSLTNIPWVQLFVYLPPLIFALLLLAVFIFARPLGFGWEAALFCALIPTSVGILGPAFLLPVSLGLLFVPISLFLVFYLKSPWTSLCLAVVNLCLIAVHSPSAICLTLILVPFLALNLRASPKRGLLTLAALLLPFLLVLPWIRPLVGSTLGSILSPVNQGPDILLPGLFQSEGYLPIILCLVGCGLLAAGGKKRQLGLLGGLLILLLMLTVFYTYHRGVEYLYERGILFAFLMIAIVAGFGLMSLRKLRFGSGAVRSAVGMPGLLLSAFLIIAVLATAIPRQLSTSYYHIIDRQDYRAFLWIESNVPADYAKALLDPWKANAFPGVAGRYVYSRLLSDYNAKVEKAYEFLRNGARDSQFLKANSISLVYSLENVSNPDLIEVSPNVYLMKK